MKLASTRLIEHLTQQLEYERVSSEQRRADERTMRDRELERILAENKRLCDENERLRLALGQPSRVAEEPEAPSQPPDPDEPPVFSGTPFERVLQREQWMRGDAGKRWMRKQLGSVTPLSGEAQAEEIQHAS